MPFAVWVKRGAAFVGTREFLELLNRIPRWRRINQAPERIDSLERHISRLEAQLDLLTQSVELRNDGSRRRESGKP
jgi:hypothetical protein